MLQQIKCSDLGGKVVISPSASGFVPTFPGIFTSFGNIARVEIAVEHTRMALNRGRSVIYVPKLA